ncbi:TatD family hydrolase [Acrocarpospora sp. B8E8]|uniref:TatD family hydrolase n=1 Tax=Acrocarpospora sp. B8E8 TaxID=3153572 RepID=UPI00325D2CF9
MFAMTRTLAESRVAVRRTDPTLSWGIGAHPGRADALAQWDRGECQRQLEHTFLVGEVGLDRQGSKETQRNVFRTVLEVTAEAGVLLSIHSTGRHGDVLDLLRQFPQRGAILHWFTAEAPFVERARDLHCFFSVNAAMTDEQLLRIPPDRMLPETDFPSSRRRTRATRPGDIMHLEQRLSGLLAKPADQIRASWYRNLGNLAEQAGASERLSPQLSVAIDIARGHSA